mmetsp:Transcript_38455/g.36808  ORF Transcript_38455/g.36808 Transcript_38455/m.36808 type:complete len:95 (+) Transcript_38455:48-332(+)
MKFSIFIFTLLIVLAPSLALRDDSHGTERSQTLAQVGAEEQLMDLYSAISDLDKSLGQVHSSKFDFSKLREKLMKAKEKAFDLMEEQGIDTDKI